MNIDFDEITETAEERLSEAFSSSKSKMTVVKGKSGRYAVVSTDVTKGLGEEFWFNLDPVGGDASVPRLRLALRVLDTGKVYRYKDEKFGAAEHPKAKAEEWWRRMTAKDVTFVNKQFRDWLSSSDGKAFVEKNGLEGCLCVKNFFERGY